jgi:glycosyltransferase involved in cell wall biosynthesis
VHKWAKRINDTNGGFKRVVIVDLPRPALVQSYLNADLFVFASNVEYSPLVLFEACAAGLPFLSVPVGNSAEIVEWTGGGEICDARADEEGFTRVAPEALAHRIEQLAMDLSRLQQLKRKGLSASAERYNWDAVAKEYEDLFSRLVQRSASRDGSRSPVVGELK